MSCRSKSNPSLLFFVFLCLALTSWLTFSDNKESPWFLHRLSPFECQWVVKYPTAATMLYYVDTTIFNGLEALLLTHSNLQLRSCHQVTLHDIYDRWRTITVTVPASNLGHTFYCVLVSHLDLQTDNFRAPTRPGKP